MTSLRDRNKREGWESVEQPGGHFHFWLWGDLIMTTVHEWGDGDKSDTERIKTEKRRKHWGRNMTSHETERYTWTGHD